MEYLCGLNLNEQDVDTGIQGDLFVELARFALTPPKHILEWFVVEGLLGLDEDVVLLLLDLFLLVVEILLSG